MEFPYCYLFRVEISLQLKKRFAPADPLIAFGLLVEELPGNVRVLLRGGPILGELEQFNWLPRRAGW